MEPFSEVERKVGVVLPCDQDQVAYECHIEAINLERSALLALHGRERLIADDLNPSVCLSGTMVQQLGAVEQLSDDIHQAEGIFCFFLNESEHITDFPRGINRTATKILSRYLRKQEVVRGPALFLKLRATFSIADSAAPKLELQKNMWLRDFEKVLDRARDGAESDSLAGISLKSRSASLPRTVFRLAAQIHVDKIFPSVYVPTLWEGKTPKQLLLEWSSQSLFQRRFVFRYRQVPVPPADGVPRHSVALDVLERHPSTDGSSSEELLDIFIPETPFNTKAEAEHNAALLAIRFFHEFMRNPQGLVASGHSHAIDWKAALYKEYGHVLAGTPGDMDPIGLFPSCPPELERVDLMGDGSLIAVWLKKGGSSVKTHTDYPPLFSQIRDLRALIKFTSKPAIDEDEGMTSWWNMAFDSEVEATSGAVVRALAPFAASNPKPSEFPASPSFLHLVSSVMKLDDVVLVHSAPQWAWGMQGIFPDIPPNTSAVALLQRRNAVHVQPTPLDVPKLALRTLLETASSHGSEPLRICSELKRIADQVCDAGNITSITMRPASADSGAAARWRLAEQLYRLAHLHLPSNNSTHSSVLQLKISIRLNLSLCLLAQGRGLPAISQAEKVFASMDALGVDYVSESPNLSILKAKAFLRRAEGHLICVAPSNQDSDRSNPFLAAESDLSCAEAILDVALSQHDVPLLNLKNMVALLWQRLKRDKHNYAMLTRAMWQQSFKSL